jgi:hypothetical protein
MTVPLPSHQEAARNELFSKIRLYAGPYMTYQTSVVGNGRGLLFVQCTDSLACMSLSIPRDVYGQWFIMPPPPMTQLENEQNNELPSSRLYKPRTRSVLMHHLTMGEFNAEVCREDFELAVCRDSLQRLVDTYDEKSQMVILTRFRCGHVAVGVANLALDYNVCLKLGADYYGNLPKHSGAVQLNLDDL